MATLFAAFYIVPSTILSQLALLGLEGASVWLFVEWRRRAKCASVPAVATAARPAKPLPTGAPR